MVASASLLLVRLDDRGEVDVGEHVAGDHEEALVELVHGVAHRAGRAEGRLLGGVDHPHAEVGAVAEVRCGCVGHEGHRDDDLVEAVRASAGATMCSIIGSLTSGIIGLGAFEVSGRSRVPSPPAMITAFMPPTAPGARRCSARPRRSARRASGT